VRRLRTLLGRDALPEISDGLLNLEEAPESPVPEEASLIAESDISEGWMQVAVHVDLGTSPDAGREAQVAHLRLQLQRAEEELAEAETLAAELEVPEAAVAQGPVESIKAADLEALCLELEQEKQQLELQVSASQYALRRLQASSHHRQRYHGCPFCIHCNGIDMP